MPFNEVAKRNHKCGTVSASAIVRVRVKGKKLLDRFNREGAIRVEDAPKAVARVQVISAKGDGIRRIWREDEASDTSGIDTTTIAGIATSEDTKVNVRVD
jgi:hypothetical protein